MNCSCVCTNTLNFCNQNVCGEIDFDVQAQLSGVHLLITEFLGVQITISKSFLVGENLVFPLSLLNENYEYSINLIDPNGAQIIIEKDLIEYDCFKFRTILSLNAYGVVSTVTGTLTTLGTIVIQSVVDQSLDVTGTTDTVDGIFSGSDTIICAAFAGVRVIVIRGNIPIPGIDPLDGSFWFTKVLAEDFITLNTPLVAGEFIRIQTIPT